MAIEYVHDLFEAQVERDPGAVAVIFNEQELTYQELNHRANQLAHHLRLRGVGPDVLVGICLERSLEMVVGLLGILKAGGAFVPLDPVYPKARLAFMLEDAQVLVLVTQSRLKEKLSSEPYAGSETSRRMVCIDSDRAVISRQSMENPINLTTTRNLAYVIYTSGSTGTPKGCLVERGNLCNYLQWANAYYFEGEEGGNFSLYSSLSFDLTITSLFLPLLRGKTLTVFSQESEILNVLEESFCESSRIDSIKLTPTHISLLKHLDLSSTNIYLAIVGGEVLSLNQVRLLRTLNPHMKIFNEYGPTEATVGCIAKRIELGEVRILIGRPVDNTKIFLLGQNGPVPVGDPGEINIGGAGVIRGYLNRPELTAEYFIPDSCSDVSGACLYRTGDLARSLPDGNIEFLGRIDQQIKIRGFRIEPGEIEAVLYQHPAIQEVVVLARGNLTDNRRLIAYVVPIKQKLSSRDSGYELGSLRSELRSLIKDKLPEYMVPSAVVILDAMPVTPNGKVDRQALPEPARNRPDLEEAFAAPRSSVEEVLVKVYTELLEIEQVGVHDDFFELGGHSLLATQLITRARDALRVELPFSVIFETPTVAGLARFIEMNKGAESSQLPSPIRPISRDRDLPLSFSQERTWFIQQLDPANRAYQFQASFRFEGPLDVASLEQSLSEIVRRHEIFRTTFVSKNGQPIQVIHNARLIKLPLVDLRTLPEHELEEEVERRINEELQKPFDLTQLPLIRWALIQLDSQEHILIQVEHHLVHDGWSFGVFLRELLELYRAFTTGRFALLPNLPVQFADFAHWQRQWMQGRVAEAQLTYWKKRLSGSPNALELPLDHPRPSTQTFHGAAPRVKLPVDLSVSLGVLSRREGGTLFITMLSAFATLLTRYTGQDDICIGSGIANRRWRESEGLIGMILNNVVLRINLAGNPTFCELLGRVRKVTLEANAHQDVPFDKVVEAVQPDRDMSRNPLFQVMFSFHDAPMPDLELPGLSVELKEAISNKSAKFDLNVIVIPGSEQRVDPNSSLEWRNTTVIWEYNTDLFDHATIMRMTEHYRILLDGIVSDPYQPLWDLPLLKEAERHNLIVKWNDTQTAYPKSRCVHELFEVRAAQTPDAVAVVFSDQQLSYSELNVRANQLAHYLKVHGVEPETLVGISMDRSLELVIGLLGILKAGGAYVPLDPACPRERIAFMLEDTQAQVLLTQERLLADFPVIWGPAGSDQNPKLVCLDRDWEVIGRQSTENPVNEATAESLAYVMYTSGSTGVPKGVETIHRGVVRLVTGGGYASLDSGEVFLQLAPFSFDASTFELWGALLHGAQCVLFADQLPDVRQLARALREYRVSILWLTASFFNEILDTAPESLLRVRQLLIGGEALSVSHVQRAMELLPSTHIINGYGPTEGTTFTCCYSIPKETVSSLQSIPIGRPVGSADVYILDRHLRPVPIGITGELYIGGDGLARGYLNSPGLTAEKYLPNPYSKVPGSRLYKSGDMARYLPDGNIEFLGRRDQQIQIRGFRIELGEIESVLSRHPAVRETVVVAREDTPGNPSAELTWINGVVATDKRLVAYVVRAMDGDISSSEEQETHNLRNELGDYLLKKLHKHMVPSVFMFLDALPLTRNGKLDRYALPVPDTQRHLEQPYILPQTETEQKISNIWLKILQLDQIGIQDNFFELGGHSLLATRVTNRLVQSFGLELPLKSLFEFPTVAGLAKHIDTLLWSSREHDASAAGRSGERDKGEI